MSITAYPLTWPAQFPRAKFREYSKFKTKLPSALKNVQDSLRLFAADSGKNLQNLVISSNCTLGISNPDDPGVSVWFVWDGMQVCIPVDRYKRVEENLQAIHHIIEARRVELRHGTLALVRATFQGFLSLPAPKKREWWEVLGVSPNAPEEEIKKAYREAAAENHPDKGGSHEAMTEINWAWEQAQKAS